jgi:hypothetical protein
MDKIILEIIKILKENANKLCVKKVLNGDPYYIPVSVMPCLVVDSQSTSIGTITSFEDQDRYSIAITIVDNASSYFGDKASTAGLKNSIAIMDAENTDGSSKADSVAQIVRKHIHVANKSTIRTENFNISYTFRDIREMPTFEVRLTFDVITAPYFWQINTPRDTI